MRLLTYVFLTLDLLLTVSLTALYIGCVSGRIEVPANPVTSNVPVVAPQVVATNASPTSTGGSSFNSEKYVWDDWELQNRRYDVK